MRIGKAGVDHKLKILGRDRCIQVKGLLIIRVLKSKGAGVDPAVAINTNINMHFLRIAGRDVIIRYEIKTMHTMRFTHINF